MEDCRKPFEQKGLGYGIKTYSVSSGKSIVPVDVNITAGKTKTLVSFNILDTAKKLWAKMDSNHRPHDYQSCALAS